MDLTQVRGMRGDECSRFHNKEVECYAVNGSVARLNEITNGQDNKKRKSE